MERGQPPHLDLAATPSPSPAARPPIRVLERKRGMHFAASLCKETYMAISRTVYHVSPSASGHLWLVSQENGGYSEQFKTKAQAVEHAQQLAREQEPSQVKVHDADGNVQYENMYGEDPMSTPGLDR